MNIEQQLEGRQARRLAAEDRFLAKQERQEAEAEQLIGELCVNGQLVYYINIRSANGSMTGRIKKSTSFSELVDYLIRNNYI